MKKKYVKSKDAKENKKVEFDEVKSLEGREKRRTTKSTKTKYGSAELEEDYGSLTFGKLIKAYRQAEDSSQKDFAQFLGISQASLCALEKGRRIPSPERAASIAKKLKEPESYWVQLAIQDHLDHAGLKLKVSVA